MSFLTRTARMSRRRSFAVWVGASVLTIGLNTAGQPGVAVQADPFAVCSQVTAAPETSDGKSDTLWLALPSNAPLRIGADTYRSVYFNTTGSAWLGTSPDGSYLLAEDSPIQIDVASLDWTTADGGYTGATWAQSGTSNSACVVWKVSGSTEATDEKTTISLLLTWDSVAGNAQVRTQFSGYMAGALEGRTLSTTSTYVYDIHHINMSGISYNVPFQNQFWLLPASSSSTTAWIYLTPGDGKITATWDYWTGETSTFTADFNEVRTGKFVGSCTTAAPRTGCTLSGLSNQVEYVVASRRQGASGAYYTDTDVATPRNSNFQVWAPRPTVTAEDTACVRIAGAATAAPITVTGALSLSSSGTGNANGQTTLCHDIVVKPGKYTMTAKSGKYKASTTLWVADAALTTPLVAIGKSATIKVTGLAPGSFIQANGFRNGSAVNDEYAYAWANASGAATLSVPITVRGRSKISVWAGLFDEVDQVTVKGY